MTFNGNEQKAGSSEKTFWNAGAKTKLPSICYGELFSFGPTIETNNFMTIQNLSTYSSNQKVTKPQKFNSLHTYKPPSFKLQLARQSHFSVPKKSRYSLTNTFIIANRHISTGLLLPSEFINQRTQNFLEKTPSVPFVWLNPIRAEYLNEVKVAEEEFAVGSEGVGGEGFLDFLLDLMLKLRGRLFIVLAAIE
jgi:hypothetical protein